MKNKLKNLNDKELKELWVYYRSRKEYLGKEECKYLIEIEQEISKRFYNARKNEKIDF